MFLNPRCPRPVNGTLLCSWLSIVTSQFPAHIAGGESWLQYKNSEMIKEHTSLPLTLRKITMFHL